MIDKLHVFEGEVRSSLSTVHWLALQMYFIYYVLYARMSRDVKQKKNRCMCGSIEK